ncbi:hypothetical protein, partial [Methylobacterium sp. WL12]|uniref:hypothetical protein n=1 Tax=Methylobacterium sp. WL12 TaxID=2603890 RepID=UPI001AEEC627
MIDAAYVGKYIQEKLPFLKALLKLFPIWKNLVANPAAFFSEINHSGIQSLKNAVVFCFSSATLLTGLIISLDFILEIVINRYFK